VTNSSGRIQRQGVIVQNITILTLWRW